MIQWVRGLATKILGPTWWNEKTDSRTLCSDLHKSMSYLHTLHT